MIRRNFWDISGVSFVVGCEVHHSDHQTDADLLAGSNAASAKSIALSSTFTTLTILMKTKATLISAIVIALAAVGTTTYFVSHLDDEAAKAARGGAPGKQATP